MYPYYYSALIADMLSSHLLDDALRGLAVRGIGWMYDTPTGNIDATPTHDGVCASLARRFHVFVRVYHLQSHNMFLFNSGALHVIHLCPRHHLIHVVLLKRVTQLLEKEGSKDSEQRESVHVCRMYTKLERLRRMNQATI